MKTRWMLCAALLLSAAPGCKRHRGAGGRAGAPAAGPITLQTDNERALYSVGVVIAQRGGLGEFHLSPRELAIVERGISDQVTGAHKLAEPEQYLPRVREMMRERQAAQSAQNRQAGTQFVERAASEPGAQRLPSGVVYRELAPGSGAQPTPQDEVVVNYRGTLPDGTEFDSSYSRHRPATFRLGGVIRCWQEGLQQMRPGGRAKLVCPTDLAYGDHPPGGTIPPGSPLVFEVELLEVHPPAPPAAPGAPAGAPGAAPSSSSAP